jgi:hypothetical protein
MRIRSLRRCDRLAVAALAGALYLVALACDSSRSANSRVGRPAIAHADSAIGARAVPVQPARSARDPDRDRRRVLDVRLPRGGRRKGDLVQTVRSIPLGSGRRDVDPRPRTLLRVVGSDNDEKALRPVQGNPRVRSHRSLRSVREPACALQRRKLHARHRHIPLVDQERQAGPANNEGRLLYGPEIPLPVGVGVDPGDVS